MKYCKNCGAEMADEAVACPQCGQPAASGKHNGFGVAGFILALAYVLFGTFLSLIPVLPYAVWLLGLIFSIVGIAQAKKKGQKKGLAVAGLVLSLIGIVFIILILILGSAILGGLLGSMGMTLAIL